MSDYHMSGDYGLENDRIEEPIIPMRELGTTVPERDPRTGAHILQNIESNIRKGVSKMQLMWQTQSNQPIGGRPKAYGKDVRNAIREMLEANQVELSASELPPGTSLSGFDQQEGLSEQKRRQDLQEVKDAIDFQVEVAGGGGVDIWSQEYPRSITDNEKINKDHMFYDYSPEELKYEQKVHDYIGGGEKPERDPKVEGVKYLYDERTGKVVGGIQKSSKVQAPKYMSAEDFQNDPNYNKQGKEYIGRYDEKKARETGDGTIRDDDLIDLDGRWINPKDPNDAIKKVPVWDAESGRFQSESLEWHDIVKRAKKESERRGMEISPEKYAFDLQQENQIMQSRGMASFYNKDFQETRDDLIRFKETRERFKQREEELKQIFKDDEEGFKFALKQEAMKEAEGLGGIGPSDARKLQEDPASFFDDQIKKAQHHINYIHETSASYDARADELAESLESVKPLGDVARNNTTDSYAELGIHAMEKSKDPRAKRDVYVGPELGWPTAYGGHPEEFIEIIKDSRKKMAQKLEQEQGLDQREAEEAATKHIRGDFDTSHLAMWYNHFEKKKGESEEQKLDRFNKWYMEMSEKLQKEDVVGSIQLVDSIGGQHSHLPAGQGIFPVSKAVQQMWEQGWRGDIVSEGHEEEQFGEGRIMTETWKEFGSPIGTGSYWGGPPGGASWKGVQGSYFGATAPPTYIVGAYTPSNDWQLWSEVPFE